MIFSHTLQQVIRGEKQQTRRLVKSNEIFDVEQQAIVKANTRTMYKVGKSYAVQPNRGKKAVARIMITDIRREPVRAISDADAIHEGFQSRDAFLETWHAIHGENADINDEVWVIEFELHSIAKEEIKALYDAGDTKNEGTHHGQNVSGSVEEVSGSGLHRGNYREWGVGAAISDRLSIPTG
jgi:hypothetical protein